MDQHQTLQFLADVAMLLRCVNHEVKTAIERNRDYVVNIFLSERGTKELSTGFLLSLNGVINVYSEEPWSQSSAWYCAFIRSRLANPAIKYGRLEMKVKSRNLCTLLESLQDMAMNSTICSLLGIVFEGNLSELVASEGQLSSLQSAVPEGIQLYLLARDSKASLMGRFFALCQSPGLHLLQLSLR